MPRPATTFTTENPATGQVLAKSPRAARPTSTRRSRGPPRRSTTVAGRGVAPADRKKVLLRVADAIEANLEELAALDALEAGKPITDCREVDLPDTVKTFRWYAEAIDKVFDAVAPTGPEALGLIVREPIGVVGAVVPWNFPILMAAWKVAPALAAGNTWSSSRPS